MKSSLQISTLALILSSLGACGNSPLFNHDNAGVLKTNEAPPVLKADDCPLEFHEAKLCAAVEWSKGPTSPGESTLTLKFWDSVSRDSAGPFVDPPTSVFVELWMPDMGHGSSPVTIEKTATGVYQVSKIYFIMSGDWDLRVQLKNGAQVVEQVVLPVSID